MHPNAARVAAVLRTAGVGGEVHELESSARTAKEAAAALGCDVGAIANSLVFLADDEPLLVLTSGAHRVDLERLAERLGVVSIVRATPEQVRAATGQPIGGVAPVGHSSALRVLIDTMLREHETIWAAAGTPHAVFPVSFDELARITGAEEVAVD